MADWGSSSFRVVVFREGDLCVAQCLEYDISGEGQSIDEALADLARAYDRRVVVGERLAVDPFAELPPAPEEYWAMWRDRGPDRTPERVQLGTGKSPSRLVQLVRV